MASCQISTTTSYHIKEHMILQKQGRDLNECSCALNLSCALQEQLTVA